MKNRKFMNFGGRKTGLSGIFKTPGSRFLFIIRRSSFWLIDSPDSQLSIGAKTSAVRPILHRMVSFSTIKKWKNMHPPPPGQNGWFL